MSSAKHVFRNTAATVALIAAALATTPAVAKQANIKSMSFHTESANTTIHVGSSDKQKWDTLKSGNVQFWGHMKLNTRWPGYVQDVGVSLGVCGPGQCGVFPPIWSASPVSRDYDHQENFSFDPSIIPQSSDTGIAVVPYGDQIISKCNQHLQADGPTKSYSFTHTFHASFSALTDTALDMDNAVSEAQGGSWPHPLYDSHYAEHGSFDVQVVCDPVIKPKVQDIANDFGEFDVENVKLFLTTYQSNQAGSTPGTVCPSLKVTSRAQANQAGPVSMRIWRQKNAGPITSEVQQAWASYDATKNGYFATYDKWEDVGATAYFQYKTGIIGNGPFEPFDGWKDITVHCTGAGGGGFTDALRTTPTSRRHIRTGRARSLCPTALGSKNSARARARWRSRSSAMRRVRFTTASAARTARSSREPRPPSTMAGCSRRALHMNSTSSGPARSSAPCRRSSRMARSPPLTTTARISPASSAISTRKPTI
ncbi:hypothetical protein [Mesorhizobium sp. M9A.F.Ca.ET.002.03.1.2]|uniref:hypothetical protein n=1 Tax=Mesorhizobium sp. M9A.F.Ca.ET.002.03.1.2 TaxID=2493668 RepID=UPI001FE0B328|nr:hypothetical protein [Mesorhizobium sp. M9A.F.Ca.ET.002.03.1.2]